MTERLDERAAENEAAAATGSTEVDEWEVEEILARFDRAAEGRETRAGGTTSCH